MTSPSWNSLNLAMSCAIVYIVYSLKPLMPGDFMSISSTIPLPDFDFFMMCHMYLAYSFEVRKTSHWW